MAKKIGLSNFTTAIDDILIDFIKETKEKRDEALDAGSTVLVEKLTAASPTGETGNFAKSWEVKKYDNGKHFVHNTKLAPYVSSGKKKKKAGTVNGGAPLSNILEYSENGKPFIRATADAAENEVFNSIKNKLNGG